MITNGQIVINAEIRAIKDLPKHIQDEMLGVVDVWARGLAISLTGIQLGWRRGLAVGREEKSNE